MPALTSGGRPSLSCWTPARQLLPEPTMRLIKPGEGWGREFIDYNRLSLSISLFSEPCQQAGTVPQHSRVCWSSSIRLCSSHRRTRRPNCRPSPRRWPMELGRWFRLPRSSKVSKVTLVDLQNIQKFLWRLQVLCLKFLRHINFESAIFGSF